MTWENYGHVWHIDHIVPCTYWDLQCGCTAVPLELENAWESRLCWHYKNLFPLWAKVNKSKKDSVNEIRILYYETYMETLL